MQHTFGLELIESVLTNHADIFRSHPEQAHVLQTRLMPFIIRSLSDRSSFPASVRVFRVLYNVLKCHLSMLASECEAAISLLTHLLDPETAAPWKRALCMEVFRGVHTEPGLVRKIYAHFDEQHGRKNVLKDHMAALARLAAEKPTVIGIGQQSTVPVHPAQSRDSSSEQAAIEAGGVAGVIGAAVGMTELNVPGISVQWSSMRVPCIDQLDKSDPPNLPESYIYSLTLTCVNSFSEGLAKFILPLTIPSDSRGKRRHKMPPIQELHTPSESNGVDPASSNPRQELPRTSPLKRTQLPVNPLTLTSHPQHGEIKTSAAMIEACWPAVLATSSTFLYASLDSDYYHSLVRSFQKFTHVAGLLRLGTPRDAFLTTLGKAAIPAGILTANIAATPGTPAGEGQGLFENAMGLLSVDSLVSQAPSVASDKHKQAMDVNPIFLNARNLLCLRALLNLGIALGSTLGQAWSIVLETIQQADLIISVYNRRTGRQSSFTGQRNGSRTQPEGPSLLANLGTEITAVETAASRMFESTGEYPNESFLDFIAAMCKLLRNVDLQSKVTGLKFTAAAPSSPTIAVHTHRRLPSISGLSTSSTAQSEEDQFILSKLGDVASINISRLTSHRPSDSGWDVIVEELVAVASSMQMDSVIRLKAAEVLNGLVLSAFSYVQSQPARLHNDVQRLGLSALSAEIRALYDGDGEGSRAVHGVDMEIHRLSLDTLKSILEQYGEALVAGWEIVFDVVSSVFDGTESVSSDEEDQDHARSFEQLQKCATKSPKLVRSSFDSLRLICSDFLSSLSSSCMLMLIDTLYRFCSQTDDFNISLTVSASSKYT